MTLRSFIETSKGISPLKLDFVVKRDPVTVRHPTLQSPLPTRETEGNGGLREEGGDVVREPSAPGKEDKEDTGRVSPVSLQGGLPRGSLPISILSFFSETWALGVVVRS